jgi:hypothetical protein
MNHVIGRELPLRDLAGWGCSIHPLQLRARRSSKAMFMSLELAYRAARVHMRTYDSRPCEDDANHLEREATEQWGSLLEGSILLYPRKEMGRSNSMRVPLGWVVSALFMKIGIAVEK